MLEMREVLTLNRTIALNDELGSHRYCDDKHYQGDHHYKDNLKGCPYIATSLFRHIVTRHLIISPAPTSATNSYIC